MSNSILITGKVLHQKWTGFVDQASIPKEDCLKLSEGWLTWYKARTHLKEYKYHGKAALVSVETAEMEQ